MNEPIKYEVGMTVWYVERRNSGEHGRAVTVAKVGRRWATLSTGNRVAIGQTAVDGGVYSSPGRIYASRAEYDHAAILAAAWSAFRARVSAHHTPPSCIGMEDLRSACAALRFPEP
jgi:hypothetical protein